MEIHRVTTVTRQGVTSKLEVPDYDLANQIFNAESSLDSSEFVLWASFYDSLHSTDPGWRMTNRYVRQEP